MAARHAWRCRAVWHYPPCISGDRYRGDVLAWSEQQSALLHRLAPGERVNDLDRNHVVEAIAEVGISGLNAPYAAARRV